MFCLLLTASSISYFYWLEEELHEKEIFALIDDGEWNIENLNASSSQIKLELKEKDHLPEGYTWEEEGREFSYKGMFYDIISFKKTSKGWELIAVSDEEEAEMVAKQSNHSDRQQLKFSKIQLIFISPSYIQTSYLFDLSNILYTEFHTEITQRTISHHSPPPEFI